MCTNEQPPVGNLFENCPSFDGVEKGCRSTQSVGESHATNSNSVGIHAANDPLLLDVPISMENNVEVRGDRKGVRMTKEIGLTGCNSLAQSISHESRLQEVQVNVLDDMTLADISQPLKDAAHESNKQIRLRASLDRMYWWATTFKDNKLARKGLMGKRVCNSKPKVSGQKEKKREKDSHIYNSCSKP
ncbi:hypothetical protein V6N11_052217 [Hibiscus sabdariffa]|uniref:Uncharacterized protein n=1 Tax=Hibiscus sabdariffa TaxID=183260 RepID=A0ABR2U9I4_9ROSI